MNNTTHYNLLMAEGSDTVNLLTQCYPNFETIDSAMYSNKEASVSTAVETKTGNVHSIIRTNSECSMFRFVATSNVTAGDSFTVDGVAVTTTTPDGQSLKTGAYVINANVLCCLVGTVLTIYVSGASSVAEDSEKLGGELPSYYATAEEHLTLAERVDDIDVALEKVEGNFNYSTTEKVIGTWINGKPIYRKTYTYPSVGSGTPTTFDTDTSHIPVDVSTISFKRNDGYTIINNHVYGSADYNYLSVWHEDTGVRGNYFIYLSSDNTGATNVTFTVDYYKTTD